MHDTRPLTFDNHIAVSLQKAMDKEDVFNVATVALPTSLVGKCTQNVFDQEDDAKVLELVTSDAATDSWYAGMKHFNFETGESRAPNDTDMNNQFLAFSRMMWRKSTKVGFGIRGSYVMAWYCNEPMKTQTQTAADYKLYKANVGKLCLVDGYNQCYNDKAIEAHNAAREKHEGYSPLVFDKDIATAIQAQLDSPSFVGTISQAQKGKYANCGENVYVLTDLTKLSDVLLTNMASNFWYKGINQYDFATNQPKTGINEAQLDQANSFQQMVWRGTKRVGFGVFDKYVVAWYCEDKGELSNAIESKANVGRICYKHGYNQCYNDLSLVHVNKMRKNHKAKPLTFDEDAARAIQHELNRADFDGSMPDSESRPIGFTGCGQSVFYQSDYSQRHEVSTTNMATEAWYKGITSYNFDTNQPKTGNGEYIKEDG